MALALVPYTAYNRLSAPSNSMAQRYQEHEIHPSALRIHFPYRWGAFVVKSLNNRFRKAKLSSTQKEGGKKYVCQREIGTNILEKIGDQFHFLM